MGGDEFGWMNVDMDTDKWMEFFVSFKPKGSFQTCKWPDKSYHIYRMFFLSHCLNVLLVFITSNDIQRKYLEFCTYFYSYGVQKTLAMSFHMTKPKQSSIP